MRKPGHPPRTLVAAIAGIIVIPLTILVWLGWQFLEQDRLLAQRQAQDRLERAADVVVTALQRAVSASEERLAAGAVDWPDGAVALTWRGGAVESRPPGRLAWLPAVTVLREAPAALVAEGE